MVWKKTCGIVWNVWRWFRILSFFDLMTIYCICIHLKIGYYRLWIKVTNLQKYHTNKQRLFQDIQNPPPKRTMQQRLYIYSLAVALSGACRRDPRFEDFEECLDE